MKLTTRSTYGIRLLLDLALFGEAEPMPIKDIAGRHDISQKYLEKIVRLLKSAGYINSKCGVRGGHMLNKPPADITVGDVVRVLEGEEATPQPCVSGEICQAGSECLTCNLWVIATAAMYEKLDAITLQDLADDAKRCQLVQGACHQHKAAKDA